MDLPAWSLVSALMLGRGQRVWHCRRMHGARELHTSLSRICSCFPRNGGEDQICAKCRGDSLQSESPGSLLTQEKVCWCGQERVFACSPDGSNLRPSRLRWPWQTPFSFAFSLCWVHFTNTEEPDVHRGEAPYPKLPPLVCERFRVRSTVWITSPWIAMHGPCPAHHLDFCIVLKWRMFLFF